MTQEAKPIHISPSEFFVRQSLIWTILEHRNKDQLYATSGTQANILPLFFPIAGSNGEIIRAEWNSRTVRTMMTEDLMGLFIVLERLGQESTKPAAPFIII